MTKAAKLKSPNVWNVLDALNTVQEEICNNMNKAELRELGRELNKVAKAFEANAPEETVVPAINEVTMSMSDLARTILDSYNLPVE